MAREMTPQERAAYVYAKLGRGSVPDIKTIYEHTQATRRAALLECLEIARADGNIIAVREQLTRLAQEG